jgi:serine/threonine-protein kinase
VEIGAGQTFGRYKLEERIGRGRLGEVWRGVDSNQARAVAVKIVSRDDAWDVREPRSVLELDHANCVRVYDVGETDDVLYIVMELVKGRPLRAYFADASIPMDMRLEWLAGTARGLGAAHGAGISHGNLTPANVIITPDGIAKVVDFGVGKPPPEYMPPELNDGAKPDALSDQYAFGLLAYELLAGVHPDGKRVQRRRVRAYAPDLTADMADAIHKMFSPNRGDRHASMSTATITLEMSVRMLSISSAKILAAIPAGPDSSESPSSPSSGAGRFLPESPTLPSATSVLPRMPSAPPSVSEVPSMKPSPSVTTPSVRPTSTPSIAPPTFSVIPPPLSTPPSSGGTRNVDPRVRALAGAFAGTFGGDPKGPGGYVMELRPTEKNTHPLVLVPRDSTFGALVAGSVNLDTGGAELRAYDYLGLLHAQRRTGKPFLDRASYEQLLRAVQKLLNHYGVTNYSMIAAPPELRDAVARMNQRSIPPPRR